MQAASRPTAWQMMPYASLNAMARGSSFVACSTSGKSSSWRPANVPITKNWPAKNVKASGAPICIPSSSVCVAAASASTRRPAIVAVNVSARPTVQRNRGSPMVRAVARSFARLRAAVT